MAFEVATGYVSIVPSMQGFGQKLSSQVSQATGVAGDRAGKSFKTGIMTHVRGIAAGLAGVFAISKGVEFFKDAIKEASDLNESANAVKVTFGKASGGIEQLATGAARAMGLSKTEFNSLAVRFSNFAGTIAGRGGDVVATMKDLTGRASDFASVMNLDVNNAAELFQSGLAGETEPLRRYGIDLSAAKVSAYALSHGIADSAGSMTESQKVQARYELLMKQTNKTQGDFANTSDQLANRQRIATAEWKNAKSSIGQSLLPVLQAFTGFVADKVVPVVQRFGDWFQSDGVPLLTKFGGAIRDNRGWLTKLAIAVGAAYAAWKVYQGVTATISFVRTAIDIGRQTVAWMANTASIVANKTAWLASQAVAVGQFIAAAVTVIAAQTTAWIANTASIVANKIAIVAHLAVTGAVKLATAAWTVAQWALNTALSANPIGIVVMAIAGLVAGLVLAYNKVGWFRDLVDGAWQWIKSATEAVWPVIQKVIEVVWGAISWWVEHYVKAVWAVISTVWDWIKKGVEVVWPAIQAVITGVWDAIRWYVTTYIHAVKTVIETVWGAIKTVTKTAWDLIQTFIVDPIRGAWHTIQNVIGNVKNWLADTWTTIKDRASTAWQNIKDAITSPLSNLWGAFKEILGIGGHGGILDSGPLGKLIGIFTTLKDGIGGAFKGIGVALATPLVNAFSWINDHVITKINTNLLDKIHAPNIPLIPIPDLTKVPGAATGGWIRGAGSGTSDSILTRLSNGEYVINARSAKANAATVEYLNSGGVIQTASRVQSAQSSGFNPAGWLKGLWDTGAGAAVGALTGKAMDWLRESFGGSTGGSIAVGMAQWVFDGLADLAKKWNLAPTGLMEALYQWMLAIKGDHGYLHECLATIHRALDALAARFGYVTGPLISSSPDPNHIIDALGVGAFNTGKAPRGALAFWKFPGRWGHIAVATGQDSLSINNWGGDTIDVVPNIGSSGYVGWLPPERFVSKFDSGGYLQPGWNATYNGTSKPEPVLTSAQWDQLTARTGAVHNWHVEVTDAPVEDRLLTVWRRQEALMGGV